MSFLYGPQVIKDKILTNISAAIREIHRLAVDEDEQTTRTLTNDDWQVHCLLDHLDFALLYGLRYVQEGYYKCVSEFTPKLLLKQIESSLNIETNIGRGRAWFFCALNDNLTESYMKCFQDNRKLVKKFYTSDAIVNDAQRLVALTTLCSGLENIQFNLKIDCVYFDRGCWPAYLQVHLDDTEKLLLPGVRHDIPSFATYLSRYDVQHIPSSPELLKRTTVTSKRVKVPKQNTRTSTTSSVVNSYVSSDIVPTPLSRSSSVSFDNPSIDGLSINDETNKPSTTITTDSMFLPLPLTKNLSSSLSELDPMLNGRVRTPSPVAPSTLEEEKAPPVLIPIPIFETPASLEQSIVETSTLPSPSSSIGQNMVELSIEKKNEDILQVKDEDQLIFPADASLQLQLTLDIFEEQNDEKLIDLFVTTIGHNNGNVEVVYLLITTLNIYLLRKIIELNYSSRLEKVESVRLELIDYIEVGPHEQFFRIIPLRQSKLRTMTTGCAEQTKIICDRIHYACKYGRYPEPKIFPATMQELSIKKKLASDTKKNGANEIQLLDYHLTFWEEPQMSGRILRKEGHLYAKLVEASTPMKRLSAATMQKHRAPFDIWRNAYVTLRVDRLNVYLHRTDVSPTLTYTLLDENCQGCRRNRNADRDFVIEIVFAHDVVLMLSAKTKSDQDEWLNAIMKGLSQGQMALKDEENSANTIPCSLMLTEEKIYVCHDEQENTLIRLLDSIKLDYVTKVSVDPDCLYYCVLTFEHANQGSKTWIFYFLFSKEMIRFVRTLQNALSKTFQVPIDVESLLDISFQRDCERTSKRLLRSYRPLTISP